jgi:arsenite methyltransferase
MANQQAVARSCPRPTAGLEFPTETHPFTNSNQFQEIQPMKTFQIYDKPMCCSTGICGPDVDPVLPRFAGDLEWLKSQGHSVTRYNLAQEPQAFLENRVVEPLVMTRGVGALPIVVVDGRVVSQGDYPSRDELARWALPAESSTPSLPTITADTSCCGGSGCC